MTHHYTAHTYSAGSGRLAMATRLATEWQRMARQTHNIRRANAWNLEGPEVTHLSEILTRCGFDRTGDDQHFDDYLSRLVVVAQTDDLATRIVFQRILPGLIATAVRRSPTIPTGLVGAFDSIVSAAWVTIRCFPIERRPHRVAANLLMDIEYQAFVRDSRLKMHRSEDHRSPSAMLGLEFGLFRQGDMESDPVSESAGIEILLHELASAGLLPREIHMLRAISLNFNSVEIAPVLNIAPRTARNRRERVITKARKILLKEALQDELGD